MAKKSVKKAVKKKAVEKAVQVTKFKEKTTVATAIGGPATLAVKESFVVRQIENVPADEVDEMIAEEMATSNVVSAVKHKEGDGEYTVVFTYEQ